MCGQTDKYGEAIWLTFVISIGNMAKTSQIYIQKYYSLHYDYVPYYKIYQKLLSVVFLILSFLLSVAFKNQNLEILLKY